MAMDMKWRDAMSDWRIRQYFSDEERGQGWPSMMDAHQLAALQRPFGHGDATGRKAQIALRDALQEECRTGALPCVQEVLSVPVQKHDDDALLFAPIPMVDDHRASYCPPRPHVEVEECSFSLVAAADFAHWLQAQDLQPSTHVAAWFKACGVVLTSATGALQVRDVQDLAALVQFRQQFAHLPDQEREPWHPAHVALLAAWLRAERAQGQARGALTRLQKHLNLRRQTLAELLQRHGFQSDGEPLQPVVDLRSAVNGWGGSRNG